MTMRNLLVNHGLGRSAEVLGLWCLLLALSGVAQAQNPEAGDTVPPEKRADEPARGTLRAEEAAPQPRHSERHDGSHLPPGTHVTPSGRIAGSDHELFVGRFGIGFFGVLSVPIMGCGEAAACVPNGDATVPAPTIGGRWWWKEEMGIEAALGLYFASESFPAADVNQFGFALHGGLPLALVDSGHFVFELVPQLNLGFASGSHESTGPGGVNTDTSGFLFELGARTGAEIHFGFIDIPQLSLQGTLGLMIRHESRSAETGGATVDTNSTSFATGVDGAPWAIFTGALTAIYYY
jgi:hypothetical protein